MSKSSYLVTGGAGFIGSHLVETLLGRGHRVRVLDNLSTGKHANLAHCAGVEFIEGDCADRNIAMHAVRGMDFVLHQAAIASVPRSVNDPAASHRANVDGTLQMLLAARDAGVRRFVFAGSSSAYGDTFVLPTPEATPTAPLSPYALQKIVGEQYCAMFTALYGLETVTTRYFNVFGPRQDPTSPYSGVIALFASALLENRAPVIYGDGEQTRDFTYVANVVDGVLRASQAPGASGQIINVATGGLVSLNGLLRMMNHIVGTTLQATYRTSRPGDVRESQADIEKAKRVLEYSPIVSCDEGLQRTLDWYRAQSPVPVPVMAAASPSARAVDVATA